VVGSVVVVSRLDLLRDRYVGRALTEVFSVGKTADLKATWSEQRLYTRQLGLLRNLFLPEP